MEGTDVSHEQLLAALKCNFNHEKFRDLQLDAIQATLSGKDSLLILPTGQNRLEVDDVALVPPRVQQAALNSMTAAHSRCCLAQWHREGLRAHAAADADHPS
jgi:hypothetical protein